MLRNQPHTLQQITEELLNLGSKVNQLIEAQKAQVEKPQKFQTQLSCNESKISSENLSICDSDSVQAVFKKLIRARPNRSKQKQYRPQIQEQVHIKAEQYEQQEFIPQPEPQKQQVKTIIDQNPSLTQKLAVKMEQNSEQYSSDSMLGVQEEDFSVIAQKATFNELCTLVLTKTQKFSETMDKLSRQILLQSEKVKAGVQRLMAVQQSANAVYKHQDGTIISKDEFLTIAENTLNFTDRKLNKINEGLQKIQGAHFGSVLVKLSQMQNQIHTETTLQDTQPLEIQGFPKGEQVLHSKHIFDNLLTLQTPNCTLVVHHEKDSNPIILSTICEKISLIMRHADRVILDSGYYQLGPQGQITIIGDFDPADVCGAYAIDENRLLLGHSTYGKISLYCWSHIEQRYNVEQRFNLGHHAKLKISNFQAKSPLQENQQFDVYCIPLRDSIKQLTVDLDNLRHSRFKQRIIQLRGQPILDYSLLNTPLRNKMLIHYKQSLLLFNPNTRRKLDSLDFQSELIAYFVTFTPGRQTGLHQVITDLGGGVMQVYLVNQMDKFQIRNTVRVGEEVQRGICVTWQDEESMGVMCQKSDGGFLQVNIGVA